MKKKHANGIKKKKKKRDWQKIRSTQNELHNGKRTISTSFQYLQVITRIKSMIISGNRRQYSVFIQADVRKLATFKFPSQVV